MLSETLERDHFDAPRNIAPFHALHGNILQSIKGGVGLTSSSFYKTDKTPRGSFYQPL